MPNITSSKVYTSATMNAFVSPFTDASPRAFYSSLTVPGKKTVSTCIPCAFVNLKRTALSAFLEELSVSQLRDSQADNSLSVTVPKVPAIPIP
jgi:hypothetical protein